MNHITEINAHLAKAKGKHPFFAHFLITPTTVKSAKEKLEEIRSQLRYECEIGKVWAEDILLCELWEIMEAYATGRSTDAISEIYDSCAVLLRMAEWIAEKGCGKGIGKQKPRKPKAGEKQNGKKKK